MDIIEVQTRAKEEFVDLTAEVGRVRVVKTDNKGKAFKRMRIELGDAPVASG